MRPVFLLLLITALLLLASPLLLVLFLIHVGVAIADTASRKLGRRS